VVTGLGRDQQIPLSTASGWDHLPATGIERSVGMTDGNELRQRDPAFRACVTQRPGTLLPLLWTDRDQEPRVAA
jgi:hypothetical protein